MTPSQIIQRFLKRSTAHMIFLAGLKGLVKFLPYAAVSVSLLAVFERLTEPAPWLIRGLWSILIAGGFVILVSGFTPFSIFSTSVKSKSLYDRLKRDREIRFNRVWRMDDLHLAEQFASEADNSVTGGLEGEFVRRIAEEVERCPPYWCFPSWNWKKPAVFAATLCFITGSLWAFLPLFRPPPHILFPFGANSFGKLLTIEPGDAFVPWGKTATVTIHLNETTLDRPVLYVKMGSEWQPLSSSGESAKSIAYELKNIVEPLNYRVLWRRAWSRKFTLTPIEPVRIEKFSIQLTPPSYAQQGQQVQDRPEITGLPGTQVSMEVLTNTELTAAQIIFSDGRIKKAELQQDKHFNVRFVIEKELTYSFHLIDADARIHENENSYPIHVFPDAAPTILLLSPDLDLVSGDKEKIPLTYEARDDIGVMEISLLWEVAGGAQGRSIVKNFEKPQESTLGTYSWDLFKSKFRSGDVVRYRMEALDGNLVTGPGKAFSDWRVLEIASFDEEHALLEKALEMWRDKAVDLLAQVNTIKSRTDHETADMSALSSDFNNAAQNSEALEEMLNKIVSRLESDPLADYGVWLEHKAMAETLARMNDSTVQSAKAAFQTQNKQAASSRMEQMASELERMTALSEELSKTQKARDVLDSGDQLEKMGQDMIDRLENGHLDKEVMAEINKMISEAQKTLAEMAQNLQNMPQELPEDFVNQQALKDLDMGKSQDILSQIQDAVRQGDAKKALALAKQFLKMAQEMRKKLGEAHESFVNSNSASELSKKISEQQEAMDKIIKEQTDVLAETQKLESKRLEAMLKAQEDLLDNLAKRQRKVLDNSRALFNENLVKMSVAGTWSLTLPPMEEVAVELEKKRVDRSPALLEKIVTQVSLAQAEMERSSAALSLSGRVKFIQKEEQEILQALKQTPNIPSPFSKEDQKTFENLQRRQSDLARQTQGVQKELQLLSRKTASLGLPLMQALGEAGSEMGAAAENLGSGDSQEAQSNEEKALDHLLDGQSSLGQAKSDMAQMGMSQEGGGQGGGSKVIVRQGGGTQGSRIGKVRLPRAEDYRPPKEFREDLLESLREKYPKIYENIIHKYYKRLVE